MTTNNGTSPIQAMGQNPKSGKDNTSRRIERRAATQSLIVGASTRTLEATNPNLACRLRATVENASGIAPSLAPWASNYCAEKSAKIFFCHHLSGAAVTTKTAIKNPFSTENVTVEVTNSVSRIESVE